MNTPMPRYLFFLTLILLSITHSFAADCKKGKTYALIVGIASYQNSSFNLKYCDDDARDMYRILIKDNPSDQIILLINEEATAKNIMGKMNFLFQKATQDDRIVFFYSGHGNVDCFIPYDGLPTGKSVLSFGTVKKAYRDSKAGQKFRLPMRVCRVRCETRKKTLQPNKWAKKNSARRKSSYSHLQGLTSFRLNFTLWDMVCLPISF